MLLKTGRSFKLNWRVSLFCLLFFPLFISLGFWQLQRAEEKQQLLAEMADKLESRPLSVNHLSNNLAGINGSPIWDSGRFREDQVLLLDNKVLKGKVGFEIIQPFLADGSKKWILVNRGFVAMGTRRTEPIDVPRMIDSTYVHGLIYFQPQDSYVIHAGLEKIGKNHVVQTIVFDQVKKLFGVEFFPFLIRLDENHPGALPRHWPVSVMKPEVHLGYSVQWFLMAFALVIMYLWFSFPKFEERAEKE